MTAGLFALVLASALCHAGWNFAARRAAGDLVVLWWGAVAAWLALTPVVLVLGGLQAGWPVVLGSLWTLGIGAASGHALDLFSLAILPIRLGIGIDENTAIVVRGDSFEVIGQGYVAIYDSNRMIEPQGSFYFLAPGDRYDLKLRQATRPRQVFEPLERVVERKP